MRSPVRTASPDAPGLPALDPADAVRHREWCARVPQACPKVATGKRMRCLSRARCRAAPGRFLSLDMAEFCEGLLPRSPVRHLSIFAAAIISMFFKFRLKSRQGKDAAPQHRAL